jgi:hypothetical protein
MSAKPLITAVLLCLAVPLTGTAQQPAPFFGSGPVGMLLQPGPNAPAPLQGIGPATPPPPTAVLQDNNGLTPLPGSAAESWVNGIGNLPIGKNGPIGEELFFYEGPSISAGGGKLSRQIDTGWMTEGGARALLFNKEQDGALTLGAGITFQYNDGSGRDGSYDYFGLPVQVRNLFRTSATAAVGYDWFRQGMAPIGNGHDTFRFGLDFGGRFGFSHVDLNVDGVANDPFHVKNYLFRSRTYGGIDFGAHADFEFPMGSWVLVTGLRSEWGYNWSELLLTANSTVIDVNILFTAGIRY